LKKENEGKKGELETEMMMKSNNGKGKRKEVKGIVPRD
jgi:hypothetical protein